MKYFRVLAVTGFLAVCLLGLFAGSLKADQLAYLLGGQGGSTQAFGTVDLNTGAFTSLGTISPAVGVTGLGVAGGTLYTDNNGAGTLDSINTSNGALTVIGSSGGVPMSNFGATTTGLYFIDAFTQDLYSINPLRAAPTLIGSTGLTISGPGTALSTNSGTLYFDWFGSLYTVNTTTGLATLVGPNVLSSSVYALLFEGGTLYGGVDACGTGGICFDTVNTGTGALTLGPTPAALMQGILGLAPDPLTTGTVGTPEPATWSLLAFALVALLFGRRRLASALR
jgi:hypothetical protein